MVFTDDEATQLLHPHHDALVSTFQVTNINLKRILIDNGSSANVLFLATYKGMGLDETLILRKSTTLIGFNGKVNHSLGEVVLPISALGLNKQTRFSIVDSPSAYNAILGRPWLHAIRVVPSTYHQVLRYPTNGGVREILGDQHSSKTACLSTRKIDPILIAASRLFYVELWSHTDMTGIDPEVVMHQLKVNPEYPSVKQKRRKFAPEQNLVINEEVQKLLDNGSVVEVQYHDWLANIIVVRKKKWQVESLY
ncbi:uncharacterized protein LOC119998569 [Tripterygium wilfordii]|uniref:uncharacterized protein LOC119998569 n=1 Tax=Tripterygium wilfordii TaxID=458696 RepID=UPI0018F85B86|nr:uncharacterized protein LOC119998569 [Tripterygium wilfordii]